MTELKIVDQIAPIDDAPRVEADLKAAVAEATGAAPQAVTKRTILDAAIAATADRGLNYGKPEDNFARIARRWNIHLLNRGYITPELASRFPYFGPITPGDVALMCADLKAARLENQPQHHDSWVDLAGYAACGGEIEAKPKGPKG